MISYFNPIVGTYFCRQKKSLKKTLSHRVTWLTFFSYDIIGLKTACIKYVKFIVQK